MTQVEGQDEDPVGDPDGQIMQVDRMFTPGAAMSTSGPKFEKPGKVSSAPYLVTGPSPPGLPSESIIADTVSASLYAAGTVPPASSPTPEFGVPAATT